MKRRTQCLFLVVLVLAIFYLPVKAATAPYYEGKMIRIIVTFPPGGGYDRMARMVARYLPKYIPGKPNVLLRTCLEPAAWSVQIIFTTWPSPMASALGPINRVTPAAQLLKIDGVKFDMLKYSWIGAAAVEALPLLSETTSPIKPSRTSKR